MAYAVDIGREPLGSLHDIKGTAASVTKTLGSLGLSMPVTANTLSKNGDLDVLWIGPQRWLLRSLAGRDLNASLAEFAGDPSASVVDVTDAYTTFAIAGAEANEVMAQASPLDVHPSAFPANGASFTWGAAQPGCGASGSAVLGGRLEGSRCGDVSRAGARFYGV